MVYDVHDTNYRIPNNGRVIGSIPCCFSSITSNKSFTLITLDMGFSEIWTLYDSKIFDEKERAALERFLAVSVVCCNENRVSEIERSFDT